LFSVLLVHFLFQFVPREHVKADELIKKTVLRQEKE
jgi:hypothetical protein